MQTKVTTEQIREALATRPRVSIAHLPTPLEECPQLSRALSGGEKGPRILIKRDDLTGQALGGNKVRHMEFRIGDAVARGADTFIYADANNAARATAAACAKVGLKCVLLVRGQRPEQLQGNMLLANVLGADLEFLNTEDREEAAARVAEVRERLEKEGRKPYALQELPTYHLSAIFSYLDAAVELRGQLESQGVDKAHVYMVNGHSQVGLHLGAKLMGLDWSFTGVAVGQHFEPDRPLSTWSRMGSDRLGFSESLEPEEIETTFDYVGPHHGSVTPESVEAIKMTAATESVILDPAYTGKAMAALIADVRRGRFSEDDVLVFVHTGGIPMLFEAAEEVSRY
jgi:1-aminocyclopropane-1-carboxylate deaminase/D-cysteine desulfhydrase-like pyridoxal-dependent ACC family enzyme